MDRVLILSIPAWPLNPLHCWITSPWSVHCRTSLCATIVGRRKKHFPGERGDNHAQQQGHDCPPAVSSQGQLQNYNDSEKQGTWHLTCDMLHMTYVTWQTGDFQVPSSHGFGVMKFWRLLWKGSINKVMNHNINIEVLWLYVFPFMQLLLLL